MNEALTSSVSANKVTELICINIDNHCVVVRANWLLLAAFILLVCIVKLVIKKLLNKKSTRTVSLQEFSFEAGGISCSFSCSQEVRQLAYQMWVELVTRKLAIPLDDNDVIVEVYNSWYEAFRSIRELLKTLPGECLDDAGGLIELTTRVLNDGLRPHLTKWQAKFRAWYESEARDNDASPQSIQRCFPDYNELYAELSKANNDLVVFAEELKKIANIQSNQQSLLKRKTAKLT